jgi:hypothetical protein
MSKPPTPLSKTRRERVEFARSHSDNANVRGYVAALDAATTLKEFRECRQKESEYIPDYSTLDSGVRSCLSDAQWECEDRIRREMKEADKKRIADNKAEKATAVERESAVLRQYLNYPMLKDAIKIVAESFRPELYNSYLDDKLTRLHRFIEGDRVVVPVPEWKGRSKYDYVNNDSRKRYDQQTSFVAPYHDNGILKPDYREMIDKEANTYAEIVLDSLREKLAWKLGPVIDRKGGGEVEPHGNTTRHIIRISFPDKSGFTIQSQLVYGSSKNYVFFTRHPMTFHNVTFADGSKMKIPSASKMKKEFGIDIKDKETTKEQAAL